MCVKFNTSDNMLEWQSHLIQNRSYSEMFVYSKQIKGEPMTPIEAELDAIERIKVMKQVHQELGIRKPESFYKYAKLAFMELNDLGLNITEEHFFKDVEGNNLFISYN